MDRFFERTELIQLLGEPLARPPNDVPVRVVTDDGVDATADSSLLRWDCFGSDAVFAQMLDAIVSDDDFEAHRDDVMNAVSVLKRTYSCLAQNVIGDLWRFVNCCPRHRAKIDALRAAQP